MPEHLVYGIPQKPDLLLTRRGFCLGYSQKFRQAIWVSYILRAEDLKKDKVRRRNRFRVDPAVDFNPVKPKNYSKTGYDRGHLVPAADMTYSIDTMKHSFFMTNITPQIPGCNRGIWKRLENQVRRWAENETELCVITGPIFSTFGSKNLYHTNIPVPVAFYKVILDMTPPVKMIGFIIPNRTSRKNIRCFVVSVDDVEARTGLDFFCKLPDSTEAKLETISDISTWMKNDIKSSQQL